MIKLITGRPQHYNFLEHTSDVELSSCVEFNKWFCNYKDYIQLDTETNIVTGMYGWKGHLKGINKTFVEDLDENGNRVPCKRECYLVQVGDENAENQWLFDIPEADEKMLSTLNTVFISENTKIIHNGLFDYTVIKWCFGVDIKNIRDTMLMSQILTTGLTVGNREEDDLPKGYHSFAGCCSRLLGIDISKTEQTGFTGEPLTLEQMEYAAIDVTLLSKIEQKLDKDIDEWNLENVVSLECALLRAYGDSMCENLYLDRSMWTETMLNQKAEVKRITAEFHTLLLEYLPGFIAEHRIFLEESVLVADEETKAVKHLQGITTLVQAQEAYNFRWNSGKLKNFILREVYPDLPENATTVVAYKKYLDLKREDEEYEGNPLRYMKYVLDKNFEPLEFYLIKNHAEFLLENGIHVPAGVVLMNLNSNVQKLDLFRCINYKLENTNKESLGKIAHPLASKLKEYNKATKLATSYGQNFLDAINPDGMFRVSGYKQILGTGRSSMDKLQLLPGQSLYREPFKCNNPETGVRDDGEEWVLVGGDYAGQELCVLATFADEPVMIDALENGYDLHSINTARLFPEKWKALGGEEKPKGKPEDKTLQNMRNNTKSCIFGIAYGKSAPGLGESLNIPGTTDDLIKLYQEEFDLYLEENATEYKQYCITYKNGKNTKSGMHDFIKLEHSAGRFLPDIVTGQDLIDKLFNALPNMAIFLHDSAEEGALQGFIRTPDAISRVRKFAQPNSNSELNAIKRAAQNYKIQSSSANITKYAICIIKKHTEDNNLSHKLKFVLPLHDEIRYLCRKDFAAEGLKIINEHMEIAGEFILNNKLLKAECEITPCWQK